MSIQRLCKATKCINFRLPNSDYCKEHQYLQQEKDKKAKEHAEKYFSTRQKTDCPFYNTTRWRQLREEQLKKQPTCEICGSSVNLQVHHNYGPEVRYQQSEELFFNPDSLQTVCRTCHNRISDRKGRERRYSTSLNVFTGMERL